MTVQSTQSGITAEKGHRNKAGSLTSSAYTQLFSRPTWFSRFPGQFSFSGRKPLGKSGKHFLQTRSPHCSPISSVKALKQNSSTDLHPFFTHTQILWEVSQLEFNVPFHYKYGYIKEERSGVERYPYQRSYRNRFSYCFGREQCRFGLLRNIFSSGA